MATIRLWISHVDASDLLALLNHFAGKSSITREQVDLVEDALCTFAYDSSAVQPKLSIVTSLHSILPQSPHLEKILGSLLHDQLPVCYDGLPPSMGEVNLNTVLSESSRRWMRCTARPEPFMSVRNVLKAQQWSHATADIVVSLVYRQSSARGPVLEWLKGDLSGVCTTPLLARVLFSLADSGSLAMVGQDNVGHLLPHFRRVIRGLSRGKDTEDAGQLGNLYAKTAVALIEQLGSIRGHLLAVLQRECEKMNSDNITPLIQVVVLLSQKMKQTGAVDIAEEVISKALPWVVQLLASEEPLTHVETRALEDLGEYTSDVSPLIWLSRPRCHRNGRLSRDSSYRTNSHGDSTATSW